MNVKKSFARLRHRSRKGAAMVELAATLPLVLTIVLGTVEISSVIYTRQALQSTAQECGRVAAKQQASDADVQARFVNFAEQLDLRNATVTTNPPSINGLAAGSRIKVIVAADAPTNAYVSGNFYRNGGIVASCWIVKEL